MIFQNTYWIYLGNSLHKHKHKNKKEHACVFLRKPGNLQPIQLIQHLHMNLDSESFKIPSYTDLIKN